MLIEACNELWTLYRAKDPKASVTDTLATKILMGALGCTPAYDQYVVKSIKKYGLYDTKMRCAQPYSFIRKSIAKVSEFYFSKPSFYEGLNIKPQGFYYPPMKIMDMVLWEASFRKAGTKKILEMPLPQNKDKRKAYRSSDEADAVSAWLNEKGKAYQPYFQSQVIKPTNKKSGKSIKNVYEDIYESFADYCYSAKKNVISRLVLDED